MTTATDTITVKLVHAVCGITAEVRGLPPQHMHAPHVAKLRLRELGEAALAERYPQLKIVAAWSESDTSYVFQVERT